MKHYKVSYISGWDGLPNYGYELAYSVSHAVALFKEANYISRITSVEEA